MLRVHRLHLPILCAVTGFAHTPSQSLPALVIAGVAYWPHASHFESTDDAYVNANAVDVAAHVAGQVVKVYIRDQQNVAAGDPLFDIDAELLHSVVVRRDAAARAAAAAEEARAAGCDGIGYRDRAQSRDSLSTQM